MLSISDDFESPSSGDTYLTETVRNLRSVRTKQSLDFSNVSSNESDFDDTDADLDVRFSPIPISTC